VCGKCSAHGIDEKCIQNCGRKHEAKRSLENPRCRWKDNIGELGCKDVIWIQQAKDRGSFQDGN